MLNALPSKVVKLIEGYEPSILGLILVAIDRAAEEPADAVIFVLERCREGKAVIVLLEGCAGRRRSGSRSSLDLTG
jgi:hypothetical protein